MANSKSKEKDLGENIIILRNVFGKVGQKTFVNPVKDPQTGMFPKVVKRVDSKGDMILSDAERNSKTYFVPENMVLTIEDGTSFNLNDEIQKAHWEAIQHCPLIAMSRDERDQYGNLIIDGNTKRYGSADFYIEQPEAEANKRITRRELVHKAETYIFDDPKGRRT